MKVMTSRSRVLAGGEVVAVECAVQTAKATVPSGRSGVVLVVYMRRSAAMKELSMHQTLVL